MSKQFSQMKTNVGEFVQDTTSSFASLIGKWINNHYNDAAKRFSFSSLINFSYTFYTVAGTSEYDLPVDFAEEIFVANISDGSSLSRMNEGEWWENHYGDYSNSSLQNGNSDTYVILESTSKIKLSPPPDKIRTIAMPYKKVVSDLVGDTDVMLIKDLESVVEYAAIGEALAYNKQYQKADYYFQRAEADLMKRVAQEKSKINQTLQRVSAGYRVAGIKRLTGDVPYAA